MTTNKDNYDEQKLCSYWRQKFNEAMMAKAPYTRRWQTYIDAYNGDYFKNKALPEYKSDLVSNYVYSIIETIRPIMLENDPKFQAMPRQPEGMQFANDLNEALFYEWDRERMRKKLYRELINTLVLGTAVFFVPWDSESRNINAIPVNPFNIFPDPLATDMDDVEYVIYASYKNVVRLKQKFPHQKEKLRGGSIKFSELVNENDRHANIDNQVLVLEVWTWNVEDEFDVDGNEVEENSYPGGRVIILCPELGVVLEDKENPYKTPKGKKKYLPFVLIKDIDVPGKFWGEGEVAQLLSPQKYMNELNNAILDNAKTTANMPWIIDKNAGIGYGKITARPGLVIRKNPGSEVKREQPPQMPMYVVNAVETYKNDMEQISGVFNTLKGENTTGVYTAQGILALQEAGQVRIRLKVALLEDSLGKLAQMWFERMHQFWKEDRWVMVTRHDGNYDLKKFVTDALKYDYDIRITAGSTMPVNRGAMLDLMVRLAQTPMPDGQNLVDREAVVEYLPEEIKASLLRRMADKQAVLEELKEAIEMLGGQLQETQQMIQQVAQQSDKADEEHMQMIEELAEAIEHINGQILQLKEEYDRIETQRQKEEEEDTIKREAYNTGYSDAEKLYTEEDLVGKSLDEMQGLDFNTTPDDILENIEALSDEELSALLESNPEIMDLIK